MTDIAKTWHTGQSGSCAVIIPKGIAQRNGFYERGSSVLVRETQDGVVLKKLEI